MANIYPQLTEWWDAKAKAPNSMESKESSYYPSSFALGPPRCYALDRPAASTLDLQPILPLDTEMPTKDYAELATEIGDLVTEKQEAYGDSFGRSGAVLREMFPNGIKPNQYNDVLTIARILDKLFRVANQPDAFGESPYRDIAGYALLGAHRARKSAPQEIPNRGGLVPLKPKAILDYIDHAVIRWRAAKAGDSDAKDQAAYYVDAYQSMRMSLFGEALAESEAPVNTEEIPQNDG